MLDAKTLTTETALYLKIEQARQNQSLSLECPHFGRSVSSTRKVRGKPMAIAATCSPSIVSLRPLPVAIHVCTNAAGLLYNNEPSECACEQFACALRRRDVAARIP